MATPRYGHSIAKAIYFLSPKSDGSFPTLDEFQNNGFALLKIADVADDSDEPEYTTIKAKESGDNIVKIMTSEGSFRLKVTTYDMSPEVMNYFLGTSADSYGTLTMPTAPYETERAVLLIRKAIDGVHELMYMAKAKINARIVGDYADDNLDQIEITIEALNPTDSSGTPLPGIKFEFRPEEPRILNVTPSPDGGTTPGTMEFAYVEPYYTDATDYEYTVDGGTNWSDVTSNPISDTAIISGLAANQLGVRVKRSSTKGNETGFAKFWPQAL